MTRRTRSFSADRPHYAYPTCSFLMKCNQTDERFVCCQAHAKLVEDRESVKSQPSKPWSEVSQIVDRLSTPRSVPNKDVLNVNSPSKSMSLPRVKQFGFTRKLSSCSIDSGNAVTTPSIKSDSSVDSRNKIVEKKKIQSSGLNSSEDAEIEDNSDVSESHKSAIAKLNEKRRLQGKEPLFEKKIEAEEVKQDNSDKLPLTKSARAAEFKAKLAEKRRLQGKEPLDKDENISSIKSEEVESVETKEERKAKKEEEEKRKEEERLKLEEERRAKAEADRKLKEEIERKMKEEAERKEKERLERLAREQEEKEERKRRLEMIMKKIKPEKRPETNDSPKANNKDDSSISEQTETTNGDEQKINTPPYKDLLEESKTEDNQEGTEMSIYQQDSLDETNSNRNENIQQTTNGVLKGQTSVYTISNELNGENMSNNQVNKENIEQTTDVNANKDGDRQTSIYRESLDGPVDDDVNANQLVQT
ncbi:DgyrCDS8341 [Dimorphilus gyrociliatus]|uniref:DgyrCDS8341 n=1 Tax=Dimorphilus gyrociliatus TaxID=2664684 RepID=A0A7I8VVE9_9ANNE|nr:DgyrCDS8341 [Dimorphilus gyrociliatus]